MKPSTNHVEKDATDNGDRVREASRDATTHAAKLARTQNFARRQDTHAQRQWCERAAHTARARGAQADPAPRADLECTSTRGTLPAQDHLQVMPFLSWDRSWVCSGCPRAQEEGTRRDSCEHTSKNSEHRCIMRRPDSNYGTMWAGLCGRWVAETCWRCRA